MALNDETEDFYPFKKRAGKGKQRKRHMRENAHVTPLKLVVKDEDVLDDFVTQPNPNIEEVTMSEKPEDLKAAGEPTDAETETPKSGFSPKGFRQKRLKEVLQSHKKDCKDYDEFKEKINKEALGLLLVDSIDSMDDFEEMLNFLEVDPMSAKLLFEKGDVKKKETSSSSSSSSSGDGLTTTEAVVVTGLAVAAGYGLYKAFENPTPASGFATGAGWG